MSASDNLSREQMITVIRFLTHRMGMETRSAMMAELPVIYQRLHPTVPTEIITAAVERALTRS